MSQWLILMYCEHRRKKTREDEIIVGDEGW